MLALLPLCLVPRASEKTDALSVISIPACFLAGWTNENTACGVLAATILLVGYRKFRKEPIGVCANLCVLAQACGAAVMILAPGNFARASSYVYDSMAVEIAARLARITLYTVVYAGVLLAALMLVHALGRAMNVNMRTMRALWFAAAALLCAYAMAASPELSDRSFTGVLALLMVSVLTLLGDIDAQSDMFDAAKLAVLPIAALLLVYGGVQAVREVAAQALSDMFDAAKADGVTLYAHSGYRSYRTQKTMYSNRLKRNNGKDDGVVAYPGASDHQTGLGIDVINKAGIGKKFTPAFANTKEGKWIAEHCWDYGFVIRYQKEKEEITQITYEPWHLRYVGVQIAQYMRENNLCLEEFTSEWKEAAAAYQAAGN